MKVGDYVRTRWGCIAKFEGIHESFYEFDNIIMDESSAVREELFVDIVEKSSPNIIDLVQKDDFVNGEKIEDFDGELGIPIYDDGDYFMRSVIAYTPLNKIDIKSIVTKEQFESMQYKVGEQ